MAAPERDPSVKASGSGSTPVRVFGDCGCVPMLSPQEQPQAVGAWPGSGAGWGGVCLRLSP